MFKRKRNQQPLPPRVCRCVMCYKKSIVKPQPYSTVIKHEGKYGVHLETELDDILDVGDSNSYSGNGEDDDNIIDVHGHDEELKAVMDSLAAEEAEQPSSDSDTERNDCNEPDATDNDEEVLEEVLERELSDMSHVRNFAREVLNVYHW